MKAGTPMSAVLEAEPHVDAGQVAACGGAVGGDGVTFGGHEHNDHANGRAGLQGGLCSEVAPGEPQHLAALRNVGATH